MYGDQAYSVREVDQSVCCKNCPTKLMFSSVNKSFGVKILIITVFLLLHVFSGIISAVKFQNCLRRRYPNTSVILFVHVQVIFVKIDLTMEYVRYWKMDSFPWTDSWWRQIPRLCILTHVLPSCQLMSGKL